MSKQEYKSNTYSEQKLDSSKLEEMGYTSNYASSNNTLIIYPNDLKPGESLPLAIMIGGDNQDSNFRNGYFNSYEQINGESLPRAIYVVARDCNKETEAKNAYIKALDFYKNNNINVSQVGVEAFSGGGGTGLMIAVNASEENPNTPVVLLLNDAAKYGQSANDKRKDYLNELELYDRSKDCDNLSIVYFKSDDERVSSSMWKKLSKKIASRINLVTWKSSDYGFCSHAGSNNYSQYYNFLLSLMGLSTSFTNDKNGYKVKDISKSELIKNITSMFIVSYNSLSLSDYLNDFMTKLNAFNSSDCGSASGNDLIELENSMVLKVSDSVSNISAMLGIDASILSDIGESIEDVDQRLKRFQDENILNIFNDFNISSSPKEEIIIIDPDTDKKDSNSTNS